MSELAAQLSFILLQFELFNSPNCSDYLCVVYDANMKG